MTTPLPPWPQADPSVLAPVAEHDDLRKVMRDILQTHASHDAVRRSTDSLTGYSEHLWALLNEEMSISALAVPEEKGGLGFGLRVLAVVLEEMGRVLAPEPVLSSAVLGTQAVLSANPAHLPEEMVEGLLSGNLVASVALGDRAAGEVAATESARGWRLSGSVERVVHGGTADLLVVLAAVEEGHALYCIELAGEGVTRTALESLDLTRRQARILLEGVPAHLLAGPDEAGDVLDRLRTMGTVALASEHVGMVQALLDMTRTYTVQRHQFDRPLASFQVVKHRIADMLVDLERARSAALYAAAVFDEDAVSARTPAAVAGSVCTDAVLRVAADTVQLHGGVGFTWEHPAHFYLRRALGDEATFGDARSHRAELATLLGL